MENILRDYQRKTVRVLYDAIRKGYRFLLLQSPTGSGKTLMSIALSMICMNKDVHYAVRTHYQVRQFVREFVSKAEVLPRVLLNKSKSCVLYKNTGLRSEDIDCDSCALRRTVKIVQDPQYQSLIESLVISNLVEHQYDPYSVRLSLMDDDDTYYDYNEDLTELCPYHVFRLYPSRFIISTYPYVFNPFLRKIMSKLDTSPSLLVIDESHNLINLSPVDFELKVEGITERAKKSVENVYKVLVSEKEISKDDANNRIDAVTSLAEEVEKFFSELDKVLTEEDIIPYQELYKIFKKYESYIPSLLQDIKTYVNMMSGLVCVPYRRLLYLYDILYDLVQQNDPYYVLVYNPESKKVYTKILDLSQIVKVFYNYEHVVLLSGTQYTKDLFVNIFKVDPDEVFYYKVPITMGTKKIYTVTGYTSEYKRRNDENNIKNLYGILENHLNEGIPKFMVIFTSKSQMYNHLKFFEEKFPDKYVVDNQKSYKDLYNELEHKDILLTYFGSRTVEGAEFVDNKGRSIIHTILIVGVPYPVPTRYLKELIVRNKLNSSTFYNLVASIQVAQAVGRAVRHPDDYAYVYLIDNRYKVRKDLQQMLAQYF